MSWTERIRAWWSGGRKVDSPAGAEEIDAELLFHLRSLVEDNLKRGMPADTAWQEAQRRFGSLRRYAEACRNGSVGRLCVRLVPVPALFVAGVFCGWLLLEFQTRHALKQAEPQTIGSQDLTGRVVDHRGKPLADATLLVILKTWPGGYYLQQPFTATTDASGRFRLPDLIPPAGQFAVQVEAFRSGYALASSYRLQQGPGPNRFEPVTLRLTEASPITLVVQDSSGRPVARARVAPASRRSRDGERHLVYFQGSEPIQMAADAAGRVGLGWFAPGDQAEILVRLPGRDWEPHKIRIPKDTTTITVSARASVDEDDDSSSSSTAESPS